MLRRNLDKAMVNLGDPRTTWSAMRPNTPRDAGGGSCGGGNCGGGNCGA